MQPEYEYHIRHANGHSDRIRIETDPVSRDITVPEDFQPPFWARLDYQRCSHCTLDADQYNYCPVARNLAWLLADSAPAQSHDPVTLEVACAERRYIADTTMQRALGSLFGLVCALSPCPHTRPLKAMGIFHLPLASDQETIARACAFFLLRAYLARQQHPDQEVGLAEMSTVYANLKILNRCFVERVRSRSGTDAFANAVIILDVLAREVDFELADQLEALLYLAPQCSDSLTSTPETAA